MKKYSTRAYYNYAKRMLEGEAAASDGDIDPDLKSLFNAVSKIESKKPGSVKRFIQIVQIKYGIVSEESLKKNMSMWLRIPIGGISLYGFIQAIYGAISSGISTADSIVRFIKNPSFELGYSAFTWSVLPIICVMLAYIFWKIFKYIYDMPRETESVNIQTTKRINKLRRQKTILESQLFINRLNNLLIESDTNKVSIFTATVRKAGDICRKIFNWIKEKVAAGWKWIKKHPYITIAFLIIIGFTLYAVYKFTGNSNAVSAAGNTGNGVVNTGINNNSSVTQVMDYDVSSGMDYDGASLGQIKPNPSPNPNAKEDFAEKLGKAVQQNLAKISDDAKIEAMGKQIIASDQGAEVLHKICDKYPQLFEKIHHYINTLASQGDKNAFVFLTQKFMV